MSVSPTNGAKPQFSLADRLRKAREFAELDQGQLADAIGMSRQAVSNAERGISTPRRATLDAWAEACGVDLHWLEQGDGDGPEPSPTDAQNLASFQALNELLMAAAWDEGDCSVHRVSATAP